MRYLKMASGSPSAVERPVWIEKVVSLASEQTGKTAAAELGSSINTIGTHMQSIYRKLQVHSKSEAVVKAIRDGLV